MTRDTERRSFNDGRFQEDRRSMKDKVQGSGLKLPPNDRDRQSGPFAPSHADGKNDGMVSAEPRVLSKHGQAATPDSDTAFARDPDEEQSRNLSASKRKR